MMYHMWICSPQESESTTWRKMTRKSMKRMKRPRMKMKKREEIFSQTGLLPFHKTTNSQGTKVAMAAAAGVAMTVGKKLAMAAAAGVAQLQHQFRHQLQHQFRHQLQHQFQHPLHRLQTTAFKQIRLLQRALIA